MLLSLSWKIQFNKVVPFCSFDNTNQNADELLANLLLDDGGQKYLDTLPWLKEGVNRINAVKARNSSSLYWSRETWGAVIDETSVKVYSMHDENFYKVYSLKLFGNALSAWIEFIQTQPNQSAAPVITTV